MSNQYKSNQLTQSSNCFKVFKQTYFTNEGREQLQYYFIKQRKTFLGIKYWKDIKHKESSWSGSYMARTQFNNVEQAEKFIQDILCPGVPRNKWIATEVKSMKCKS